MSTKNIPNQRRSKEIVMVNAGQQTLTDTNKKIVSTSINKKNLANIDQNIVSANVG